MGADRSGLQQAGAARPPSLAGTGPVPQQRPGPDDRRTTLPSASADVDGGASASRAQPQTGRRLTALLVLAVLMLVAGSAVLLWRSQDASVQDLQQRIADRANGEARLVAAFNEDVLHREALLGRLGLGGPAPQEAFEQAIRDDALPAAVLLDATGVALAVYPRTPGVVGTNLASRYDHLRRAVAGTAAVSNVVPSAALADPVVGYATPYDTPSGRRVLSGAYRISATPLPAYLRSVSSLRGNVVHLIDGAGVVIESTEPAHVGGQTLQQRDPALWKALRQHRRGYTADDRYYYAVADVPGSDWRVVLVVPEAVVLAPVQGTTSWLPWLLLGVGTFGALILIGLQSRLLRSRHRLFALAHTDELTGLRTRRCADERLRELSAAEVETTVLLLDLDHFKRINDTFGHSSGDRALQHVAEGIREVLRPADLAARWGGEEFLVVLPELDLEQGRVVAERLLARLREDPVTLGREDEITLSASVGVASGRAFQTEVLVHSADRAMYKAKAAGRGRVHTSAVLTAAR
ncbi:MAG: sensor domain-containing diguanylate cyclase [Actinobacteria bacterium]|nr:sensor domain-containing diguanylate cyclase [Actinomycetota bacterium]MCA1720109.1 sensor domain-containing diguanylate cyclase [Actinomycetota bacterium]